MQCVTCGVKLPPGISTCFYCGTPTPYNAAGNPARKSAAQVQNAPFTDQAPPGAERFSSGMPPSQSQRPPSPQGTIQQGSPFAGAETPPLSGRPPFDTNSPFSSFSGVEQPPFPGGQQQPSQGFVSQSPSLSDNEPSAFSGWQPQSGQRPQQSSLFHEVDVHPFSSKEFTSDPTSSSQPLTWQPASPLFEKQPPAQPIDLWQPRPSETGQPSPHSMSTAQQFFAQQRQQPPRTEPTSQSLFSQTAPPQSQSLTPSQVRPFETDQLEFPSASSAPSWPLGAEQAPSAPANPLSFSAEQQPFQSMSPSLSPSFDSQQSFSMGPPVSSPSLGGQASPFPMNPSLPRTPFSSGLSSLPGVPPLQETPLATPPQNTPALSGGSLKRSVVVVGLLVLVLVLAFSGFLIFEHTPQTAQVKSPTPTPVPTLAPITTTDPQALYTQATARKPLLTDSLRAQDANDWGIVSTGGDCAFKAGTMQVSGPQGKVTICAARGAPAFSNVAYQVQATAVSGDTVGIVFRADALGRKLYLFSITTEGVYLLSSYDQPGFQAHTIVGGMTNAINKGQNKSNLITVIARGKTMYLYVNKQYLTKVDDTTSATGLIGTLVGDTEGNTASATFSNAQVWSV